MPQPLTFGLAKFKVLDTAQKPIAGANVTVKAIDSQRNEFSISVSTEDDGTALFAVPQRLLPQLPIEADYEIRTAKGLGDRGKVRCGGNEQIKVKEVVLQSA